MHQQFCYIQSAFRLASQIPQNNCVSASEIFPQHKGFQEPPREVRKATYGISCPRIHGGSVQAAAPNFSLRTARPSQGPEAAPHRPPRQRGLRHWDSTQQPTVSGGRRRATEPQGSLSRQKQGSGEQQPLSR